jgi:hypothetical protein
MLGYVPENRRLRAATNFRIWLSIRSRARLRRAGPAGRHLGPATTDPTDRTPKDVVTIFNFGAAARPRQHPRVSRRDEAGTGPPVGQRDSVQPGQAHLVDRRSTPIGIPPLTAACRAVFWPAPPG